MSLLVETIKVNGGRLYNIDYHSDRYNRSRKELFGTGLKSDLTSKIIIPAYAKKGLFKCRIEYDDHIRKIEFLKYELKETRSLRLVEAGDLRYDFKYIERGGIEKLLKSKEGCDDILIIKDGRITDTSYANIVVKDNDNRWFTPSSYLLPGTKRAYLLDKGTIAETEITPASLRKYEELRIINSMIDISDTEGIPVESICF
jgi:4-amino-4-deoxychorismate lyase